MADKKMEDLDPIPSTPFQTDDKVWLSRDMGDGSRKSFKTLVSKFLSSVSNLYNSDGAIPQSIQRMVSIGKDAVLLFSWDNQNSLVMAKNGMNFSGEQYLNKSLTIPANTDTLVEVVLANTQTLFLTEGKITARGGADWYFIKKTLAFTATTTSTTLIDDQTEEFNTSNDQLFGYVIEPSGTTNTYNIRLQNKSNVSQKWTCFLKFNTN